MTSAVREAPPVLSPREDTGLPARLAVSAAAREGGLLSGGGFDAWLAERRRAHPFEVSRIPFAAMEGWHFAAETGNLVHRSGRFFSVEGLHVSGTGPFPEWYQPIIKQPEVGILGIAVKEFDGVLHFLMQAKMEPGNPNLLQLSPTVQATRSNYTRVHKGAPVRYLEYFAGAQRGRVIADVLQSEHGWWFYRKSNRNMVVELDPSVDVPLHDDFRWLTLGEINELMSRDNLINMDSRTVLSCLPPPSVLGVAQEGFRGALAASFDPAAGAVTSTPEVLSWFTGLRSDHDLEIARVPLRDVPGWHRTKDEIVRDDGRHFRVVAVSVRAGSREVGGWSQPLLEPNGRGVAACVVKEFGGVLHMLLHAKVEGGFLNAVELGPTVQCRPGNYDHADRPLFYDYVTKAGPDRIRYDAVHSEEGGRFLNAESRYLVVEGDESLGRDVPADYAWVAVGQLVELLKHGQYVNMHARTLVACLNAMR
ncbi:NDP-hexose 2,3-dehydratase family protein [Streptomyces sp. NPDC002734]|uniref:NDP-hexose 2,3-dehydratase family protein n=1 Tax=Streptomyces sp. NPDC002734 TaxID=3154426 RepID=UPI00331F1B87